MGVAPVSPNSLVYIDNWRISGFVTAAEFTMENELMNAQSFETSGPRWQVGNYQHTHNHTMLQSFSSDNAADNIDDIVHGLAGSSDGAHYLGETRGSRSAGAVVTESVVKLARKPHTGQNGQLQGLSLETVGFGPVSRGKLLMNSTNTASTTGTYSSQTQSTYPANTKYQAVVRVPYVAGSSWSITVDIEGSSNGSVWSTMPDLTVTRTTPGVTRLQTSSAEIKPFVRARVSALDLSTGTTAIPLVVTAGVVTV